MTAISKLLGDKGREVWTVGPDESLRQAMVLMAEKNVGALPVVEGERIVGILSERDVARRVVIEGLDAAAIRVAELMTREVLCASPEETVEQCLALVSEKRCRHLPVIEAGRLVGLISIGDLVKSIIAEQQFTISQLERYISS